MKIRSIKTRRGIVAVPTLAFAVGILASASVAFAASLSVTSSQVTTSSSSVSVGETTCTLTASADAGLDRATQNSNYGSLGFLSVRSQSGNNMRRSILRFDIATCGIPATAVISSATLGLTVSSGPGSSRTYGMHRVTGTWAEGTVTFRNQPPFAAAATSSVTTGTAPATLSWSVLTDVEAFARGTASNNGWLIKDSDEGASPVIETIFPSREAASAADRPTLVIGYYR